MKKINLFIGILLSLLITMPLFAQRTLKEQKQNKTKLETLQKKKNQNTRVVTEKKMEQKNPILKRDSILEPVKQGVNHDGYIDPITGEWISPPSPTSSYVSITSPESNLLEGEGLNKKIKVKGQSIKKHIVEIRVQTGTVDASNYDTLDPYYSKIIEDWRPVTANSDGNWETIIDVGGLSYGIGADWDNGDQHFFTVLVRDTNDRSKIEVLHLTRLSSHD